jgi:hypothetical protein
MPQTLQLEPCGVNYVIGEKPNKVLTKRDAFETRNQAGALERGSPPPRDLIPELQLELARQWLANLAEHCGHDVPPWPHEGRCHWPLPVPLASLHPSEVYLLLLEASGESFGLRLQAPEG